MKRVYNRFISTTKNTSTVKLEEKDWTYLNDLSRILKVFYSYTLKVSKNTLQICSSLYDYMEIDELICDICEGEEEFENVQEVFSSSGRNALKKFSKYYKIMDSNDIYYICAAVDLFAKNMVYERYHELETGKSITKSIIENCESLYPSEKGASIEKPPKKKRRVSMRKVIHAEIMDHYDNESDIRRYFSERPEKLPIPIDSNSDDYIQAILAWWRNNAHNYPCMSQVAKDHLSIPAASVQVERIFSGCRDLFGIRRFSLHSNTVRMLTQYKSLSVALNHRGEGTHE